jgi:hypothetical protein
MPAPIESLHPVVRSRRIGLCGGTTIQPENAAFAEELGRELVAEEGLVLVTGGFKCFAHSPEVPSGDWSFIKGARERLRREHIPLERKIETLLPDPNHEPSRSIPIRFSEGAVITLKGRSLQSRRFKLVGSVDTLVAIEGAKGTREIIDLALALEKPVLPLPFTGGVALLRWNENRKLIHEWFEIDRATAQSWEEISLKEMSLSQIAMLTKSVKHHLLHQLRRKCFVMMPFADEFLSLYREAIKRAVEDAGFLPVRTDQLDLVGDVVGALHAAIRSSACGIAVITRNNANVMYELGLAHAQAKPVVLLCEREAGSTDLPELPYDLRHESVIAYSTDDLATIRKTIRSVLEQLKAR